MPRRARNIVFLAALAIGGCAGTEDWMPLENGRQWKYLVRQAGQVMTVSTDGPIRVGTDYGRLLTSEGGNSKMVWVGGELRVAQLSSMKFDPPITLLKPKERESEWTYSGKCGFGNVAGPAKAALKQEPREMEVNGTKRKTLQVTLSMPLNRTEIEMVTWFEQGVGILQQEQRNDGKLVSSMTLLSDRGG